MPSPSAALPECKGPQSFDDLFTNLTVGRKSNYDKTMRPGAAAWDSSDADPPPDDIRVQMCKLLIKEDGGVLGGGVIAVSQLVSQSSQSCISIYLSIYLI